MNTRYQSGVYEIVCKPNGYHYVGSSRVCIMNRLSVHKFHLRRGSHANQKLQADWIKFGEVNFLFKIIKRCKSNIQTEEQRLMDYWEVRDKLYNIQPLANSPLGFQLTLTQRKHASEAAKRRCTAAWRAAVSVRVKKQHAQKNFGKHTWRARWRS